MKVVYNSFDGRYSDNPRALHAALLAERPDAEHVWLADPRHAAGFPADVQGCPTAAGGRCRAGGRRRRHLQHPPRPRLAEGPGRALPADLARHAAQAHPLGRAVGARGPARPARRSTSTAGTSCCRRTRPARPRCARPSATTAPCSRPATPATTCCRSPDREAVRARVRRELGIPDDDPVVLYAPTWRDDACWAPTGGRPSCTSTSTTCARARPGAVLLLRLHYFVAGRLAAHGPAGRARRLATTPTSASSTSRPTCWSPTTPR